MRRVLGVVLAASVAVLLGACGDDDGERVETSGSDSTLYDEAAYVEAVSADLAEGSESMLDESATRCFAAAIVQTVTVDVLNDAGVSPEELAAYDLGSLEMDLDESSVADDLAEALSSSCPIGSEIKPAMARALGTGEGEGISEEGAECVTRNVDDAALATMLAEGFVDGSSPSFVGLFAEALDACPGGLADLFVAEIEAGSGREVSAEDRACIEAYLAGHPGTATEVFAGRRQGDVVREDIAAACPSAYG